jgi:II/X family phage/plasmid replication protein
VIDWLTFRAPLAHDASARGPLWNGSFISIKPDPELGETIEFETLKRLPVEGSYSNRITVQSTLMDGRPAIWVSGCPAKWFQGHNVHGSDDVHGLCLEMLARVCSLLKLAPSASDLADWRLGNIDLTRTDVTYSWWLSTLSQSRAFIRALAASAHLRHRGAGQFKGETLYFGKNSTRWSLKLYAKGLELQARPLPVDLQESSLLAHAEGLVRVELCLRSKLLASCGLARVSGWGDNSASELHARLLSGLEIAEATMLQVETLEGLSGRLQVVYQSWRDGHDLRSMLARRTFYRYRRELLAHGIDIAVKQERTGVDLSNVVPLRAVLVAQPVAAPDWLVGTPWYFEPRAKVA